MPEILQNILIILLAGYMTWDNGSGVQLIGSWPVCTAFVMGLITGDWNTALVIGGTLQLMSLGVTALGGASIPEYGVATIVSIFIATRTGVSTGEVCKYILCSLGTKIIAPEEIFSDARRLHSINPYLELEIHNPCFCSDYFRGTPCKSCYKINSNLVYNRTRSSW